MDEASRVIESFESLWFFTGVFSPINRTSGGSAGDEITAGNHVKESPIEEPQNQNISPALQNKLNHEFSSAETSVITFMCPKCGEFAAEIVEPKIVEPVEMDLLEYYQRPIEKQERRRTRRRRKRSKNRRRKTLGELDLGFDLNEVSDSWMFEETCRYPMFEDQHPNKLPSFNDDLAMKEHLKSWAHAVACTVR
ncbi:hypothetical protein I3842_09G071800 [Carya illinoinensis]|uniref:Uncharacterized protein n=1 Tax=Carya illinoinensis TaxID=32201 RepID=A0A922E1M2_CARIL|nr:hypothetical protein I3842_09G071800 [Carya illinoinensis]